MDRILQVISGVIVRFTYVCVVAPLIILFVSLVLTTYERWSAAYPQLKITDRADSTRVVWGPTYRNEFLGKSLFRGGLVAGFFSQTYPVYCAAKDGSWEGVLVPETVLEHIAGRARLLLSLRAEQPAFEVRQGRSYQLVLARPTWASRTTLHWQEKALSDDAAWALQVSRGHLRHHRATHDI